MTSHGSPAQFTSNESEKADGQVPRRNRDRERILFTRDERAESHAVKRIPPFNGSRLENTVVRDSIPSGDYLSDVSPERTMPPVAQASGESGEKGMREREGGRGEEHPGFFRSHSPYFFAPALRQVELAKRKGGIPGCS